MFVCAFHYTHSPLSPHRSSIPLILLALRIVNAYANSFAHAVMGIGYRGRTRLMFPPCSPFLIKPPLGCMKLSMRGC